MHSRLLRPFFTALVFWALCAFGPLAVAQITLSSASVSEHSVVTTPRVRAELVVHAPDGLQPGTAAWLGVSLQHAPGWHTYWRNSGDSGLPTTLEWRLPDGLATDDIAWPAPHRFEVGPLVNYGYEGDLLLPIPLAVLPHFRAVGDSVQVQVHARWLVCRVECIPEEAQLSLRIPTASTQALHAAQFAQAFAQQPIALPGTHQAVVDGEFLQLRVSDLPASLQGQTLGVFPESPDVLLHAARLSHSAPTTEATRDLPVAEQQWEGALWTARWPLSPLRGTTPADFALTLTAPASTALSEAPLAWSARLPISGQWQANERLEVSEALAAALQANAVSAPPTPVDHNPLPFPPAASTASLALMMLSALIGGLLLNLMPCVFPVLAIKVMGLTRADITVTQRRSQGMAYTVGVLLSFLALAGLLLALRSAGEQLGWGFQLQSPAMVAALAALFTVIGLNLAGVFEFGMWVPQRWAQAHAKHPLIESLWTGVLAVIVASPCTAPFMGASVGMAMGLSAPVALAIFASLGLGMALPYLLLSWLPALSRWLPRPGAWMEIFRQAMAFPMFLTVAWLVWVLGQQSGIDGAAALLLLLVALAAVLWAWSLRGTARWLCAGLALVLFAGLLVMAGPAVIAEPVAPAEPTASTNQSADWAPWSPVAVQSHLEAGRAVFVDFTAAWCVTCQFNKRTTLSDSAVLADFKARQVATLRADWTRQDPQITQALRSLGRSGVPVYVLYAPGQAPVVLSEVLRPAQVHAALSTLQP